MSITILKVALILSIFQFAFSKKLQFYYSALIQIVIIAISSFWAINAFMLSSKLILPFIPFLGNTLNIEIDQLSAFFILVINFTVFTGLIYSKGYLQPYFNKKSKTNFITNIKLS